MMTKGANTSFNSLLASTSIPGIYHAFKSKDYVLRRPIWVILFIAGLALTILQVEQLLADYTKYPVRTKVSVLDSPTQKFPAITICPLQPVKCENLIDYALQSVWIDSIEADEKKLFCNLASSTGCDAVFLFHPERSSSLKIKDRIEAIQNNCDVSSLPSITDIDAILEFYKLSKFTGYYHRLSHTERLAIGTSKSDLIKSCSFNNMPCERIFEELDVLSNIFVGNCFTFNAKGEAGLVRNGPGFSINFYLYLGKENSPWVPFNEKEGFRVSIHEPGEKPLVNEQGLDISPGMSTRFAVQVAEFHRQPPPHTSKCVSGWDEVTIKSAKEVTIGYTYTQSTCVRLCTQLMISYRCDCLLPALDEFNLQEQFGLEYCTVASNTTKECANDMFYELAEEVESACNCKPSCLERTYDTVVSSAIWPSEVSWVYKAAELKVNYTGTISEMMENDTTFMSAMNLVRGNLAHLQVFFRSTRTELKVEEKKYPDLLALFTELGGALSVWMGISFIILIEAIELILQLLYNALK